MLNKHAIYCCCLFKHVYMTLDLSGDRLHLCYKIKKNILGFYKIYLLTCALICTVSCCATEGWQEVFGIFLEELASLLDLSTSLPIFLLPLSP